MVLESLVNWREAETKPWKVLVVTFLITTMSIWLSYYIFPDSTSLMFLSFLSMATMPLIYKIMKHEEEVEEEEYLNMSFFQRHYRVIEVYTFFFIGVIVTVAFWHTVLSPEASSFLFSKQVETLSAIRSDIDSPSAGMFTNSLSEFGIIFLNNLQVSFIAFITSFLFGTGAIFILAWNASILGVFSSIFAKEFTTSPLLLGHIEGLLAISLHGIPEMFSYFIAGLAGGILSVGVIRSKHKKYIVKDAIHIYLISVIFVFIGAVLEAFVTPLL